MSCVNKEEGNHKHIKAESLSDAADLNIFLLKASAIISLSLFLSSVLPSCLCVHAIISVCVWVCVSKSLFLAHKWVMVWSWWWEVVLLLLPSYGLGSWQAGGAQRPSACHQKRPLSWVYYGGLPWLSQFALLHGRAFCLGFKIPGDVWLLWRILWERICLCVCLRVSPVIPERQCD